MVNARTMLLANVDLHCVESGDGPPLIVHHGGPGLDLSVIEPHLRPLGEQMRVICFDHRGAGRSGSARGEVPYHIDNFVEDIRALAEGFQIGSFALLGHSFGGVVALHFALAHPELLTYLILVSAPASHDFVQETEDVIPLYVSRDALAELGSLQDAEPSDYVMRRSLELLAPIYFHNPALVADLGLDAVRFGPDTQAVWNSLEGFDLRPRLSSLQVPTLVVAGTHDRSVSLASAKEMADALPRGRLLVIENSGHYPFIEQPQEFLDGVRRFLGLKVKGKRGLFGRRS